LHSCSHHPEDGHEWPKHVGSYQYSKLTFTYPSALVGLAKKL